MNFITNIVGTGISGVPNSVTGILGDDGTPSGNRNNGGTEITPQDGGNVPSAGTESREGINNDKSVTGSPYNPDASSTDSQSIGPSSSTQNNYAKAQSHSLYKQASISNDKTIWDLYKQEPVDVGQYNSPTRDLSSYDGLFSIQNGADILEGQTTKEPNLRTSITVNQGGSTSTSVFTEGEDGTLQTYPSVEAILKKCVKSQISPCEIDTCADGTPLGKKIRIFESVEDCNGRNGYWMQVTNPVKMSNRGVPSYEPMIVGIDQTKCEEIERGRKYLVRKKPNDWSVPCWKKYKQQTLNNPEATQLNYPVYAHTLTFVGDDLNNIKSMAWCEYCNQSNPTSPVGSPSRKPCHQVNGLLKTFLEGPACDKAGNPIDTHSRNLYGCCCPGESEPPYRQDYCLITSQKIVVLNEIDDTITIGSSDDPCDCLYRSLKGPTFLDDWKAAPNNSSLDHPILCTGCNKASAMAQFDLHGNNGYKVVEGGEEFASGPVWNADTCAWDTPVQLVTRCINLDTPSSMGYCATGPTMTVSDRNMFVCKGHTNDQKCEVGCDVDCASGNYTPLFNVGDQVRIDNAQPITYDNVAGSWENPNYVDLLASGAGISGELPFSTGCAPDGVGQCVWTFTKDDPSIVFPDVGTWALSWDDCICGVSGCVTEPPSNHYGQDNDTTGIPCDNVSGCSIFHGCWNVVDMKFGGSGSSPDSLDCTWGYVVSFTGNVPGITCDDTGIIPTTNGTQRYIPETFFTSGTC